MKRLQWENERDVERFKLEHKAFRNDLRMVLSEAFGGESTETDSSDDSAPVW